MKRNILLTVLLFLAFLTRAQTISQNPHTLFSDQAVCPGLIITYTVTGYGSCGLKWTVVNGTISGSDTNVSSVSVTWKDTPGTGTLTVTLSNCGSNTTLEGKKTDVKHVILSVKGQDFDPIGYNTNPRNVDYCNPAQVDLYVSHM